MANKVTKHELPRIHDHFDGSAHCVECKGECQLPPAEYYLTHIARYAFETAETTGKGIPHYLVSIFHNLRIDFTRFRDRAKTSI